MNDAVVERTVDILTALIYKQNADLEQYKKLLNEQAKTIAELKAKEEKDHVNGNS